MQAAVFDQSGEPRDVLRCVEIPAPELAPGELRVRMLASPINPSDLLAIRGRYTGAAAFTKPAIINVSQTGFEGTGIVEGHNAGLIGRFFLGRRVAVVSRRGGTWAEFVTVPSKQAVPLPASLPDEQAACFFINPATAYLLTCRLSGLPRGAWMLQTAAASAVGQMVIRLAKRHGLRTINVVRRAEQAAKLESLGADVVVTTADDLPAAVAAAANSRGVPYAIDAVGGALGSQLVRCLSPGGRLVVYGTLSGEPLSFSPRDLMSAQSSVQGFWLASALDRMSLWSKLRLVRTLWRLVREGVLATDIAATFPLSEIHEAVALAEQPGRNGKILVTMP